MKRKKNLSGEDTWNKQKIGKKSLTENVKKQSTSKCSLYLEKCIFFFCFLQTISNKEYPFFCNVSMCFLLVCLSIHTFWLVTLSFFFLFLSWFLFPLSNIFTGRKINLSIELQIWHYEMIMGDNTHICLTKQSNTYTQIKN